MANLWLVGTDLGAAASYGASDGGAGGSVLPTSSDDISVGPISFPSGTTTLTCTGNTVNCRHLTMTNTGTVVIPATATINVNGNASLANVSNTTNFLLVFTGNVNHALTSNGTWVGNVDANFGATYYLTLQDDCAGNRWRCYNGNLDFNGHNATSPSSLNVYNSAKIWMRNGTFTFATVIAQTSTAAIDFGTSYINVTADGGTSIFPNGAQVASLRYNQASGYHAISAYTAGDYVTIGQLYLRGGSTLRHQSGSHFVWTNAPIQEGTSSTATLRGATTAAWYVSCSHDVALTRAAIQYSVASGGGIFTVDHALSTIDANSSGWYLDNAVPSASNNASALLATLF